MSKFKLRDTVRILSQAECIPHNYIGCKGVIVDVCGDGTYRVSAKANDDNETQDWYYSEERLEKWEEKTMNKPKFKVGDKVKIVRSGKDFSHVRGSWNEEDMSQYVNDGNVYTIEEVSVHKSYGETGYIFEEIPFLWDERLLEKFVEEREKVYRKGKYTIAEIEKDGVKYTAKASCNPIDEYDFFVGAKLALDRLEEQVNTYKVVCTTDAYQHFTKGKIYEVKGGMVLSDAGIKSEFTKRLLDGGGFIRIVG